MAAKPLQETSDPSQDYLDRLTAKIDRAYKKLSSKERATPQQLRSIGRLFSLRALCLAEQQKRLRRDSTDAVRPEALAETSTSQSEISAAVRALADAENPETTHALGWHNRLFGAD